MAIFDKQKLVEKTVDESDRPLIMLVDDEVENLNVLKGLLESKYQIVCGMNGREALEVIDGMAEPQAIQLIICDQRMPYLNGTDFFEQIIDRLPDTIRILLTGYSDLDAVVDAINKAKIYKFMTKPFEPPELLMTVQRGIEAYQMGRQLADYARGLEEKVARRTEELEQKNRQLEETNLALNRALEELEEASLTDPLTGAYNRRFVTKFLPQELARIHREYHTESSDEPRDVGFLLIDSDHFKEVNDSYGHDAGDRVLKQIVGVLRDVCREADWIVRWGGEEFLVISRFTDRGDVQHLAERIRQSIAAHEFELGEGRSTRRTCSMGLTAYPLSEQMPSALSWQNTVNLADLALYRAKQSGRNTWIYLQNNTERDPQAVYQDAVRDLATCIREQVLVYSVSDNCEEVVWQ